MQADADQQLVAGQLALQAQETLVCKSASNTDCRVGYGYVYDFARKLVAQVGSSSAPIMIASK